MVEVAGIQDRETLEAWLKGRSREDAVCIVHRAALRVAPILWNDIQSSWVLKRGLTALSNMWPIVVSGVACKKPSPTVGAAARQAILIAVANFANVNAQEASERVAFAPNGAAANADLSYAARSVDVAFAAAIAVADTNSTFGAAAAATDRAAIVATDKSWLGVRMDCAALEAGGDPFALPLWDGPAPESIADAWARTREEWAKAGGPVWAFWTQFYENALLGRPQDWPLLHDIALIPAEDWQGGPDRVHPIIEGMLLERAVKATPNAERITLNPETGKLRVETISSLPPKYLHDAVDSLRDAAAIFDAKGGGNNSYALILPDVALLRNGLDRYGTRPNMLVVTCRRVVQRVETKVASGDCPRNDALVEDFLGEVARVISDLLIFDPEVREAASARAAFRLGEVSPQDAKTVERAADEVALASEGVLSDEVPKDARMVSDPTRSEAERHEALFETASRFFRVQTLVKGYKAVRPAIKEAADVSKEMAIIAGTWTGLPAAVAFLLKLFL